MRFMKEYSRRFFLFVFCLENPKAAFLPFLTRHVSYGGEELSHSFSKDVRRMLIWIGSLVHKYVAASSSIGWNSPHIASSSSIMHTRWKGKVWYRGSQTNEKECINSHNKARNSLKTSIALRVALKQFFRLSSPKSSSEVKPIDG